MKLFVVIIAFLLASCENRNLKNTIINDAEVEVNTSELAISSVIEVKRMIPLETNELSLIGNIDKLMKRNKCFYIKSGDRSLMIFDQNGAFLNPVGHLGIGPEEYSMLLDFDVNSEFIYILTVNKIQVYNLQGQYVKSIPLSMNVSGFRLVKDKILLFVLGDKYVINVMNLEGKIINKTLERNQALRLCKSIPFVWYGDQYLLFSQGRSNDILAYNIVENKFENMCYLSSLNNLSAAEETQMMESEGGRNSLLSSRKRIFDGLTSSANQTVFGSIEGKDVILWVKDFSHNMTKAYELSSLKDDVTFTTSDFLVRENTDGGEVFLTYIMPYTLEEGLNTNQSFSESIYYKKVKQILNNLDVEEANPVIIEYTYK